MRTLLKIAVVLGTLFMSAPDGKTQSVGDLRTLPDFNAIADLHDFEFIEIYFESINKNFGFFAPAEWKFVDQTPEVTRLGPNDFPTVAQAYKDESSPVTYFVKVAQLSGAVPPEAIAIPMLESFGHQIDNVLKDPQSGVLFVLSLFNGSATLSRFEVTDSRFYMAYIEGPEAAVASDFALYQSMVFSFRIRPPRL